MGIFEDIKKNKSYRYCVFYIKEEKSITVEAKGDRDASYEDFLHDLQSGGEGECRYGLFDFEYEHRAMPLTKTSFMIFKVVEKANADTDYLTLNTSIAAREQPRALRSKNCF